MTEEQKLDLMKKFKKLNVAEYTIKHGDYYGLMFAGAEIATKELQDKIKDLEWQLQEVAKDNDNYQKENKELQEQIERMKLDAVLEKMKCCENCKYSSYWGDEVHCNYGLKEAVLEDKLVECHDMDKWELKR